MAQRKRQRGQHAARNNTSNTLAKVSPWSWAALAGYLVAAFALVACAATGSIKVPLTAVVGTCVLLVVLGIACILRDFRGEKARLICARLRPVVFVVAIPCGFYLIERPYNSTFPAIDPLDFALNLIVLGFVFLVLYFLLQRSRACVVLFLGLCLFVGVANHFVVLFKGSPILPSDILSLGTALQVGDQYHYVINDVLLECFCVFACALALLVFIPRRHTNIKTAGVFLLAAALTVSLGFTAFQHIDLRSAFGVEIDAWTPLNSYEAQGAPISLLKCAQDSAVNMPEGYSTQRVDELLASQDTAVPAEDAATGNEDFPTVIAVLNETFSDLSSFPGLDGTNASTDLYYRIAQSSIESGYTYVPTLGGGTCNSEFEFLCTSSKAFMGTGAFPYVQYNLDNMESLVSYFSNLGYNTHAIHPASKNNWKRRPKKSTTQARLRCNRK